MLGYTHTHTHTVHSHWCETKTNVSLREMEGENVEKWQKVEGANKHERGGLCTGASGGVVGM